MSIGIVRVEPATIGEWEAAFGGCGHATHFHSPQWARTWFDYSGGHWVPAPVRVTFTDGRSAVIVRSQRMVPSDPAPMLQMSAAAGTFGGWVSADGLGAAHGRLLQQVMLSIPNLIWRVNPYDAAARELPHASADTQETMTIDLARGVEDLRAAWRRGSGSMLRAVRRAGREGLHTRTAADAADWDAYFALYEKSVARWGSRVSSQYERSFFDLLSEQSPATVRLWLAVAAGQPVAGAIVFYAHQHAVYWHGAADHEHFPARPVNLLMHDVILDAHDRGYRWFDMNPSGGHAGVARFKRHCGARPLAAPVVTTAARRHGEAA